MSLKKLANFFVTIEEDEDDVVPPEAADEDLDVAIPAARERVEAGPPVGRVPRQQKQVRDYAAEEDDWEARLAGAPAMDLSNATPDLSSATGAFDDIYRAAGLPGASDPAFTIYKVEKILQSEHLAGLGDKAKAASVLVTLEASGVGLTSVISDAVSRDQALDMYDQNLRSDLDNMAMDVEISNASIEAEIADYLESKRQEIASNKAKVEQAQQLYLDWQAKKVSEEERLFDAVAPFVAQNPITRDDS